MVIRRCGAIHLSISLCVAALILFPSVGSAEELSELRHELELMKQQIKVLETKIESQKASDVKVTEEVTQKVLDKVQPSLAAASKSTPGEFNPAMGVMLDAVVSAKKEEKNDFEFRSAEIALSANIDPFAKGYAIFNGTSDGVEVEEAAIVTTSLPYNLNAKGGRFFADFGRLSTFHDHDLPFVNRPLVLDTFVGGESQADGVEVSYLLPVDQYVSLTAGAYNKIGADNDRVDNATARGWNQFTYLGRATTSFDLGDTNQLDLGTSVAVTPDVEKDNGASRTLTGFDITLRHTPLDSGAYNGFIWSTEVLHNQETRPIADESAEAVPTSFKSRDALGLYSYAELKVTKQLSPGFLFDWMQDLDRTAENSRSFSPYLSFWLTEYQRLRVQYTRLEEAGGHDDQFFLQWTAALGNHAHGFRQR